jgi:hypothetical protein
MMTTEDLQQGKIYKIVCNITGDVYIGSTCYTLPERLKHHHLKNNRAVSRFILERGDFTHELIEDYPCETKAQLLWRERHYYDTIKCINLVPPIVSKEEAIETKQAYRDAHKEETKAYNKQYRENNARTIAAGKKKWADENVDAIYTQRKGYRERNAEEIKLKKAAEYQARKATKVITSTPCGCGGTYTDAPGNKNRHMGTKKHVKWVADSLAELKLV